MIDINEIVNTFLEAACAPRAGGHTSGDLRDALTILAEHPDLAGRSIHAAAALGDADRVRAFLLEGPEQATIQGGPRGWGPLSHLCFSRFLRLDPARSDGFVQAARALLDAGASANSGWWECDHQPHPEWESVLYGAAGVAHHEGLTRLLLAHGADPNDGETTYHAPESYEMGVLKALVESGRLSAQSLATMLLRKADWHHFEGIKYLLENGADPNLMTPWGKTALHNALISDNALEIIAVLLEHHADPAIEGDSGHGRQGPRRSAIALAARRGRSDVLELFARKSVPLTLEGVDRLIAACALGDMDQARSLTQTGPALLSELLAEAGDLLAEFAGNGNVAGVGCLLHLGAPVDALYVRGDGYFGVAPKSTALHVAAWRARHDTVRALIERGGPIEALDGWGRSPLALAVKACVDSYWTSRRSPESVQALLAAGASVQRVGYPCGYPEVDRLLADHGATPP